MCISTAGAVSGRLEPHDRETITDSLRGRGLRLTFQREAVCETIFNCVGHICAEHILSAVSANHPRLRMNKTTVYRTLDLLLDLGLVTEHKCGEGRAQYELASRGRHSHLICRECGALMDIDPDVANSFRDQLCLRYGVQVDLEGYPVVGLCPECSRGSDGSRSSGSTRSTPGYAGMLLMAGSHQEIMES